MGAHPSVSRTAAARGEAIVRTLGHADAVTEPERHAEWDADCVANPERVPGVHIDADRHAFADTVSKLHANSHAKQQCDALSDCVSGRDSECHGVSDSDRVAGGYIDPDCFAVRLPPPVRARQHG